MNIKHYIEILFVLAFCVIVNTFLYFSFANVYSSETLNAEHFTHQYTNGVYQYRFLSTYLLLKIYDFLNTIHIPIGFKFYFWKENATPRLFLAFYLLNTFFLGLCGLISLFIQKGKTNRKERLLTTSVVVFGIVISQFVLVPYDISSYFFILLFLYLLKKYLEREDFKTLFLLGGVLFISTLNRESSALSISLAGSILFLKNGLVKKTILPLGLFVVIFIITYLGMRFQYGGFSTNDGNLLIENLTMPKNYLGLLFGVIFFGFTLLISGREKWQAIILFHLLSLPYIVMCFYTGILYEIRLYIPLFITAIFIPFINFKNNNKTSIFANRRSIFP